MLDSKKAIIPFYFHSLPPKRLEQFSRLAELVTEWNAKVNLISRKDIQHIEERHILHSLSITKVIDFLPQSRVIDIGTGGGFPGLPLAILYPEAVFFLVDSIQKKIAAVSEMAKSLGLTNVVPVCARAEDVQGPFDFVISRAVAPLEKLIGWSFKNISKKSVHHLPNGLLCLKGGDLSEEMKSIGESKTYDLSSFFSEPFFETKKIVYIPLAPRP